MKQKKEYQKAGIIVIRVKGRHKLLAGSGDVSASRSSFGSAVELDWGGDDVAASRSGSKYTDDKDLWNE